MSVKPFVILILLTASIAARAQRAPGSDTVLKGSTIEVIQSYKPRVKQSPKPEWIPQLPPADTAHPAFSYDVPQQALNYTYNSLPLRPLSLGKNPDPLPFPNYLKAGGGNLSTIYLDAGIGGIYGPDYETAIHLHHISQKGSIKNEQSSLSGIEAEGTLHKAAGDWHAAVAGERNQYDFYGYDHVLHDYPGDSVRQTYTSVRLMADFQSKADSTGGFSYHPGINASLYNARFNTSEVSAGFDAPLKYTVDTSFDLLLGLTGNVTSYKADTVSANNNFVQIAPGVGWNYKNLSGHALVGFALGKDKGGYILPDVIGTYKFPDLDFAFSLGYKASLRQNTYEQLSTENTYMLTVYNVMQSRRDEVFANLQGEIGNHFSWSARGSWWKMLNLATFLNDNNTNGTFYVDYMNTQAIAVKLGVRYHAAYIWSVGFSGDYNGFYSASEQYVWHQPSLRIRADVMVRPIPKLTLSAYIYMLSGIHARDIYYNTITLKPFTDLGLNAEYQIIPRLSAFIQVNNLLNNKYERWRGYEAYGLNIYGGLRLKF
jgi:hypothetical protein